LAIFYDIFFVLQSADETYTLQRRALPGTTA